MLRKIAKDIKSLIKSGFKQVSDEIYKQRLEICGNCEHYSKSTTQCKKCLCFMPIKAGFAAMECPLEGDEKKWGKVELPLVNNIKQKACGSCGS